MPAMCGVYLTVPLQPGQDVLDNMDKLEGVEQLVVAHVSERHGSHRNVVRLLSAALPPSMATKVGKRKRGAPPHFVAWSEACRDLLLPWTGWRC